jgi:hypothetical protein
LELDEEIQQRQFTAILKQKIINTLAEVCRAPLAPNQRIPYLSSVTEWAVDFAAML